MANGLELFRMFGTVVVKNDDANKGIDETVKKAAGAEKAMGASFAGIAVAAAGVAAAIGGIVVALKGLKFAANVTKEAVMTSSAIEEMQGKFDIVFGNLKDGVRDWASEFSDANGRSVFEMEKFLAESQNMMVGMGATREEGAKLSKQLIQWGVNLASFNDLADSDALDRMLSAVSGNHEASKALGAALNENTIAMTMQQMGLQGLFKDLSEVEKMQVRLNTIIMQSTDATDNAVVTGNSFANQWKRLQAILSDVWKTISAVVLPAATELVSSINSGIQEMIGSAGEFRKEYSERIADVAENLRLFVGNSLINLGKFLQGLGKFLTASETSWNSIKNTVVNVANDIWSKIIWLWEQIKPIWEENQDAIIGGALEAWNEFTLLFGAVINTVWDLITGLWEDLSPYVVPFIKAFVANALKGFEQLVDNVRTIFSIINKILTGDFAGALDELVGCWERSFTRIKEFFTNIGDFFNEIWGEYYDDFLWAGEQILNGLVEGLIAGKDAVIETVSNLGNEVINKFKGVLGIHSPSRIFKWLGNMIGDGLSLGIGEKTEATGEAIEQLGQSILDGGKEAARKANEELIAQIANDESLSDLQKRLLIMVANVKNAFRMIADDVATGIADVTVSVMNGTGSWTDIFNVFAGIFDNIMKDMISNWIKSLLIGEAAQESWLLSTIKSMAAAAASFISTAYAGLLAFFAFAGPAAPLLAGGVIAGALAAMASLGAKVASSIGSGSSSSSTTTTDTTSSTTSSSSSSSDSSINWNALLAPLSQMNNLINIQQSTYDLLDNRLALAGSVSTSSISIGEINISTMATDVEEIADTVLDTLEEALAERQAVNRRLSR